MESDCAASFGTEAEGVDPTLFLGIISLRLRNKIGKEFHDVYVCLSEATKPNFSFGGNYLALLTLIETPFHLKHFHPR